METRPCDTPEDIFFRYGVTIEEAQAIHARMMENILSTLACETLMVEGLAPSSAPDFTPMLNLPMSKSAKILAPFFW